MANWQKPETVALWLMIGVTLVLVLIGVLILFTRVYIRRIVAEQDEKNQLKLEHQKNLLLDSIRVQERERNRIAADLHDGLIARLNVLLLLIHSSEEKEKSTGMLKESITQARRISHDLSPPLLHETTLPDLINSFVSPVNAMMKVRFFVTDYSEHEAEDDTKLQLLRIVQEIVNNAIKYSEATQLEVSLRVTPLRVFLLITDNGKGFSMEEKSKGLGMKNIEMRVQALNGDYRLKTAPEKGVRYLVFC